MSKFSFKTAPTQLEAKTVATNTLMGDKTAFEVNHDQKHKTIQIVAKEQEAPKPIVQPTEAKPVDIKIEPIRSTVPAKPVPHGYKLESPQQQEPVKSNQDSNIDSLPISTMDENITFTKSVIMQAKSRIETDNQNEATKQSSFNYYEMREKYLQETITRIKGLQKPSMSLSVTKQPTVHTKSSVEDKIFLQQDLLTYYQQNRQECQQEPKSIKAEQLIDFYVYVYGDRAPKIITTTQEAVKYRFKVPQCAAIENSILVSGRFDTEIIELKNNTAFYNQVNPALFRAEQKFLESLNKLSNVNMKSIVEQIVLLMTKMLSVEPLNKIPKTVMYVFVDSVITKACIEHKFQLQYFEVMKQVFASESFIKLIFKYPADKENYESKVKQAKAYSAAQEGNYQRQYCENQARTLMFNVIDEQVKSMNPRSLLFEITEDMTADQKQYKLDLIEIFFVGLSKFVSILTINKFIQIDRFVSYATALLRFNYNAQFVDTKNMYEAEILNANVQFNEKFSFEKFQMITFKQQISLLKQCLPDLFWFADSELVKTYKLAVTPNEKQSQALQSVLIEEFHAKYISVTEEQLAKFAESKNCDDILPVKKLQAFIDARKQIVNDFTKYVVPFYQFLNARQQFEIDELQFHLSKQFKGVNNAFYNQVQAFKSKNVEKKVVKQEEKKKQVTQVTEAHLEQIYTLFLESDVESAVIDVFDLNKCETGRQFNTSLIRQLLVYIPEKCQNQKLLELFYQQLLKFAEKKQVKEVVKDFYMSTLNYNKILQFANIRLTFEYMIKKGVFKLTEFLKLNQQVQVNEQMSQLIDRILTDLICSEDDEENYPIDNLQNYVSEQETEDFISGLLYVNNKPESNDNIFNVLKKMQVEELFAKHIQNKVSNADQIGSFLTEANISTFMKNTKSFKQLMHNIFRQNLTDLKQFLQQAIKIRQPTTQETVDFVFVSYSDACKDDSILLRNLEQVVQCGVVNRDELIKCVNELKYGPSATLKDVAAFKEWSK
ncbi:Conserved_hypothetical protein [Hexamita inflata]|uniref:Uncharacterized protein n=1 Tax=Hexamita inflata TaxID=28002 RepID=A0ABP1HGJ2_9EUKA